MVFTACNGNSEKAMPMTQEDMSEYVQHISEAAKSIEMGTSMPSKVRQGFKEPLERMGYDFDATVINMTKIFANAKLTDFTQITAEMAKINDQIHYAIQQQPELLVKEGFISEGTKDKILTYLHFREMRTETIQALKYVEQCQNINGGICKIRQYVSVLLDSNFVSPHKDFKYKTEFSNLSIYDVFYKVDKTERSRLASAQFVFDKDKLKEAKKEYEEFEQKVKIHQIVSDYYSNRFDIKVKYMEFGKYLVYQNGDKVNANGFIEDWRKPFKLRDGAIEELNNYDPWWIN